MALDVGVRSRRYAGELMAAVKTGDRAAIGITEIRAHLYEDLQRDPSLRVNGFELEQLEKQTLRHFINGV
jgi:hypothetical protein